MPPRRSTGPAGLLAFEDVDVGVVDRALDRLEIIAERGHARDARPGHDGLGQVPAAVEAQTRPGRPGRRRSAATTALRII
ncbi:MAG: hypothetical protein MZV64_64085 [Ignavibacteriales bacterium]|nr:hypothetical protein [Ignavibacteriales bacterium]